MSERVLIIKEEHLALVYEEWLRRYEESPENFCEFNEDGPYGEACANYVFELAKEMGYVQY